MLKIFTVNLLIYGKTVALPYCESATPKAITEKTAYKKEHWWQLCTLHVCRYKSKPRRLRKHSDTLTLGCVW